MDMSGLAIVWNVEPWTPDYFHEKKKPADIAGYSSGGHDSVECSTCGWSFVLKQVKLTMYCNCILIGLPVETQGTTSMANLYTKKYC